MRLIVVNTAFDTGRVVARLVGDHRPRVLGVATGSSPEPAYRELVRRSELAPSTVLCLLDEYVGLAPGSAHRYRSQIESQLGGPLGALRIEGPDVDCADLPSAAAAYEQTLDDLGGVDVQILGVGRNGHIGFNEPGTSFSSRTHVATTPGSSARWLRSRRGRSRRAWARSCGRIRSCLSPQGQRRQWLWSRCSLVRLRSISRRVFCSSTTR